MQHFGVESSFASAFFYMAMQDPLIYNQVRLLLNWVSNMAIYVVLEFDVGIVATSLGIALENSCTESIVHVQIA